MLKFLLFLRRIHVVLLFVVLEALAIGFFVRSNLYYKARFAGISSAITHNVYQQVDRIQSYFGLRKENQRLVSEIAALRGQLGSYRAQSPVLFDSLASLRYYDYRTARVINNKITKRENYLTIDQGSLDGIEPDMALLTDQGIVGYVVRCSDHYSVAISILNTQEFRTSGRIKGSEYFGSVYWDGASYREVILDEVPKYASLAVGDTVVTTDYSYIFPPDQPIGRVSSFELINGTFFKARVELFADMGCLRHVYAVRYRDQQERRLLEQGIEGARLAHPQESSNRQQLP